MFFNPNDYKYNDKAEDDDSQFINRNGDIMQGQLQVPYLKLISTVNPITFGDDTIQKTAFNIDNDIIKDINTDISNIRLDISKFNLDISDINTDINNISYDKIFNKTTISGLTYINNLSTGNLNTSHLTSTTSNLQSQLNALNQKTVNIVSDNENTYVDGNLVPTNLKFLDESTQVTAFLESHRYLLEGATSNLQDQINNIAITSSTFTTPLTIKNSVFDDTIEKYDQPDYAKLKFHNGISLQGISTDRTFLLGSLSDVSDGAVAQFAIGANAGSGFDTNIFMSISRDSVYFFGIKQPLVPVGAIQIFAGSSAPDGYFLCQGQAVEKSTYNLLWGVIGNTYLNGRAGGTPNFYLPDLRGVFIRGAGLSTAYEPNVQGGTLGEYQEQSIEKHSHTYSTLNVVSSVSISGGVGGPSLNTNTSSVYDNTSALTTTSNGLTTPETRPYNISMNYIIKY